MQALFNLFNMPVERGVNQPGLHRLPYLGLSTILKLALGSHAPERSRVS